MEQDLRKKAINLYLKGGTPKSIYAELNRSKNWLFKWLKRYQAGDSDWYKDKSRAPKKQPTAISEVDKQRIISVRNRLDSQKFAQIGASAIKWELSKSGFGFPSDRTINRVLKKEGLVKKKLHTLPKVLSIRNLKSLLISIIFIKLTWSGKVYKERWQILFIQCDGSVKPSGIS